MDTERYLASSYSDGRSTTYTYIAFRVDYLVIIDGLLLEQFCGGATPVHIPLKRR